jgi:hypothetical protein
MGYMNASRAGSPHQPVRQVLQVLAASTIAAFAWPLFVWLKRKLTPVERAAPAE